MSWVRVCEGERLVPDRGVCALVGRHQVAIFRTSAGELFAIANYDPFSKAFVISRGIVGGKGDAPKVASPIYKQTFDLRTGRCFEDPRVRLRTFDVREDGGTVEVRDPDGCASEEGNEP